MRDHCPAASRRVGLAIILTLSAGLLAGCLGAANAQNLEPIVAVNVDQPVAATLAASGRPTPGGAKVRAGNARKATAAASERPTAKVTAVATKSGVSATPHAAPNKAAAPAATASIPTGIPSKGSVNIPANSGSGRRVIYAKTAQRVWVVNADGSLERTYLVSGRMDQPDPGTYRVFSKSRHATSAVAPPATMNYMIRFAKGKQGNNIGFHDLPRMLNGVYEQTEAQLGQPLSAGCVRQRASDAAFLWKWASVGTTVVVMG